MGVTPRWCGVPYLQQSQTIFHPSSLVQVTASNQNNATKTVSGSMVVGLPEAPNLPADAVTPGIGKITLRWTADAVNNAIGTRWVAETALAEASWQQSAGLSASGACAQHTSNRCLDPHSAQPLRAALDAPARRSHSAYLETAQPAATTRCCTGLRIWPPPTST